jgi:hypothetical protein
VRRLFRHRLEDARLVTVERDVLGVRREGDVAGWEIPTRYLDFVRGGPARPLEAVLTHNADDVVALARLLAHFDACYADSSVRTLAPAGDLVALARAFTRDRRHHDALDCLDEADAAWRPATLGSAAWPFGVPAPSPALLSRDRIRAERARTLRRLGRTDEALAAWEALAADGGAMGPRAWVEAAKVREHSLRDPAGALRAAEAAARADRARLRWAATDFEAARQPAAGSGAGRPAASKGGRPRAYRGPAPASARRRAAVAHALRRRGGEPQGRREVRLAVAGRGNSAASRP